MTLFQKYITLFACCITGGILIDCKMFFTGIVFAFFGMFFLIITYLTYGLGEKKIRSDNP
jgi:hypothetical protein